MSERAESTFVLFCFLLPPLLTMGSMVKGRSSSVSSTHGAAFCSCDWSPSFPHPALVSLDTINPCSVTTALCRHALPPTNKGSFNFGGKNASIQQYIKCRAWSWLLCEFYLYSQYTKTETQVTSRPGFLLQFSLALLSNRKSG